MRLRFVLCDFVLSFMFPILVLFPFRVLCFRFEFCVSVLGFVILF